MKLYIYSVDNKDVSDKFINSIRNDIPNVMYIDYDTLKYNLVSRLFYMMLDTSPKTHIMINKICNITTKYNDLLFRQLIDDISCKTTNRTKVFIRCNDIKFINKLKRYYKRDRYYTLRIINAAKRLDNRYSIIDGIKVNNTIINKLDSYKWDSKITYINNIILNKDAKRFMLNHVGIKIIH